MDLVLVSCSSVNWTKTDKSTKNKTCTVFLWHKKALKCFTWRLDKMNYIYLSESQSMRKDEEHKNTLFQSWSQKSESWKTISDGNQKSTGSLWMSALWRHCTEVSLLKFAFKYEITKYMKYLYPKSFRLYIRVINLCCFFRWKKTCTAAQTCRSLQCTSVPGWICSDWDSGTKKQQNMYACA